MKNKILSFLVVFLIVTVSSSTNIFASYADFGEEEATKKNEEMIKEQEKEHNVTEVKSSDNYLSGLQVEGYTLTPEFDKQTLEYTIKEEVKSNEINIKTTTSNEKAKVNGAGIIKIEENKTEYRIEVTAENGSVRTYIIKLKATTENSLENNNEIKKEEEYVDNNLKENSNENVIEQQNSNAKEGKAEQGINLWIYFIVGIILLILFNVLKNSLKRKKRKH